MHEQQKRSVKIMPDYAHIETMRLLDENKQLRAEVERLRAENADMRSLLTNIVGDDEYLRIYALEEAIHYLALADQGKGSGDG